MLHAPMEQNSGKGCSSVPQGRINKLRKENSTFKKEVLMFKRLSLGVIGLALIVPMALNAGWIYKGHKSDTDADSRGDGFNSFYTAVGQGVDYYYDTSGYWGACIDAYGLCYYKFGNGYWSWPMNASYGVYAYVSGYVPGKVRYGDEIFWVTHKIKDTTGKGYVTILKDYWWSTRAIGDWIAIKVAGTGFCYYCCYGVLCETSVSR